MQGRRSRTKANDRSLQRAAGLAPAVWPGGPRAEMSASVTTSLGRRTQSRAPYTVTARSEVVNPLDHLAPDRARVGMLPIPRRTDAKRKQAPLWQLEIAVVELLVQLHLGDFRLQELLAVAVDEDLPRLRHAIDLLILGDDPLLGYLLLGHRIDGAVLHLGDEMGLLVEIQDDVALAFLDDADTDSRLVVDVRIADDR